MSTSYWAELIIGAQFNHIFNTKVVESEIDIFSKLGKKTGEKKTVKKVFVVHPNGKEALFGTNECYLEKDDYMFDTSIKYDYYSLFDEKEEECEDGSEWVHTPNSGYFDPLQCVIGLEVKKMVNNTYISIHQIKSLSDIKKVVEDRLKKQFGYTKGVLLASMQCFG